MEYPFSLGLSNKNFTFIVSNVININISVIAHQWLDLSKLLWMNLQKIQTFSSCQVVIDRRSFFLSLNIAKSNLDDAIYTI